MNTTKIISAAREIERNRDALKWLEEFGGTLTGADQEAASVHVKLNYGSAILGSNEAAEIMSTFAGKMLPEIVKMATSNCRNTIEILKQQIVDETK